MNFLLLTQEQLWSQLRTVDKELHDFELNSNLNEEEKANQFEYLTNMRLEIIETFKEDYGYNPDNLCASSK